MTSHFILFQTFRLHIHNVPDLLDSLREATTLREPLKGVPF